MSNRSLLTAGSALLSQSQAARRLAAPAILRRIATGDIGMQTFDQATLDSTGVFLLNELIRLDQTPHLPLVATTWERDIDLRSDVSMSDQQSGFTNSGWAAAGGINPTGINWSSNNATSISRVLVDVGLTTKPLRLWDLECSFTIVDLQASIALGRPIDSQQIDAMNQKWDMDTDAMVNVGDSGIGATGLLNNSAVSPSNVANGAGGSAAWATKTPQEIMTDVNTLLNAVWTTSAVAMPPEELRLPTLQFAQIANAVVSSAGSVSILEYLAKNCVTAATIGKPLNIKPIKWLDNLGAGGSDRMVAYTRRENLVRYPRVQKMFTPVQYRGIWQSTTYYGRLGEVEVVYPGTVGYADGI